MKLTDLITHADKVFWPDEGYTKLDLARYYDAVFDKLRPYVDDRLLSLERCPDGMRGNCFYQKAAPKGLPEDTPTQRIHHQNRDVEYVVGGAKDTQLALVNLGCIPVHVWASRASHPQQPDWMVFDLDPTSGKFADAANAGLAIKDQLDELGLVSFPKTSGSRGLHVFVPLRLGPTYDDVLPFAKEICERVAADHPRELTVEQRIEARGQRVYLDAFRNAFGATVVATYQTAAFKHIGQCTEAMQRMRSGLEYLRATPQALAAFRLANYAILLQQIQSRRDSRTLAYDAPSQRLLYSQPLQPPDPTKPPSGRGMWRPFQIAFFVMVLESIAERGSPDREIVELIWFPTGGGKTEAYLALSAFSMFLRRLRDKQDTGVDVLMRYTLRLLTAQQFQRAAGLICAMDFLRRRDRARLGDESFSIGIWVGGDTTPNTRAEAVTALNSLRKNPAKADNPFVVTKCPWCGAQLGPLELPQSVPSTIRALWATSARVRR